MILYEMIISPLDTKSGMLQTQLYVLDHMNQSPESLSPQDQHAIGLQMCGNGQAQTYPC